MKVIARCEWVSPSKEIVTKKGETMRKVEAKFSFADADDKYMHDMVVGFYNKRADAVQRSLKAGECCALHFSLRTWRTAGGAEYNDINIRDLDMNDKSIFEDVR